MKRLIMALIVLLTVPSISYAGAYVLGNFGFGGSSNAVSGGAEFGGIFLSSLHPTDGALSAGLGFSVTNTKDSIPSVSTTPLAGPIELSAKEYNDGYEYEGYVNIGAELAPAFFLTLGGGYAWQKVQDIAYYDNGQYYKLDSSSKNYLTGMLGLRYAIQAFSMGIGFHTRRGVVLSLGVAFN